MSEVEKRREGEVRVGDHVRDTVNGLEGIVTARCEYLTGVPRCQVEAMDESARPVEWWFDECRLTVDGRVEDSVPVAASSSS